MFPFPSIFSGIWDLFSWSVFLLCCFLPDVFCLQFAKTTKKEHTNERNSTLSAVCYPVATITSFLPNGMHGTGLVFFTYIFCIKIRHSMWVNNINPTWILWDRYPKLTLYLVKGDTLFWSTIFGIHSLDIRGCKSLKILWLCRNFKKTWSFLHSKR